MSRGIKECRIIHRRLHKTSICCFQYEIRICGRVVAATSRSSSSLPIKTRLARKKPAPEAPVSSLTAVAYSTAEEYDLKSILNALKEQGLYKEKVISEDLDDVLYASAKYQVSEESRELFIFREGSVVFWNFPEIERKAVLKFLKPHEEHSYSPSLVNQEVEALEFTYHENKTKFHDGSIYLSRDGEGDLEKYTFSSGLALSVKLAIWEASLDSYVMSIEDIIEVMNEKLTHCCELMELLSHHLEDKHHVRLEVMIIVLIMVEVLFECVHYASKFM
ncbi:hypothetical protein HPB51_014401 [Rhipicephalus microplus]|uniref:DUF155 domain-containing protein n=1 Tax=Rhipicephalus microplus TaxID=6941 RepID=A0A9J6F4T7_RHIMP|nr:hypothetical protein HPB51_014401 [Rhipicephalus microplus]